MISPKIRALFVLLWAGIRYLIIKAFWPLFRPSKANKDVKIYHNGDIITTNGTAQAVVTKGHKITFVGELSKVSFCVI